MATNLTVTVVTCYWSFFVNEPVQYRRLLNEAVDNLVTEAICDVLEIISVTYRQLLRYITTNIIYVP